MRAFIPTAGIGTRLRPQTYSKPKALVQVAGKPVLGHILDPYVKTPIKEIVMIVGYKQDQIEEYLNRNYANRFKFIFVTQEPRLGLGHSISVAAQHITEDIIIGLGDMIFQLDYNDFIKKAVDTKSDAVIGVKSVDQPQHYGVAEVDKNNQVINLVEKPKKPRSDLALTGLYYIRNTKQFKKSLQWLMNQPLSNGQEYQLTDALQNMIESGSTISVYSIENWLDCGRLETILHANQVLLKETQTIDSQPTRSVIIPPTFIGKNCEIVDSVVGPFVSISHNCKINRAILRNSIVSSGSEIDNVVLMDTLVGDDAKIIGSNYRLNVGDGSSIIMK